MKRNYKARAAILALVLSAASLAGCGDSSKRIAGPTITPPDVINGGQINDNAKDSNSRHLPNNQGGGTGDGSAVLQ